MKNITIISLSIFFLIGKINAQKVNQAYKNPKLPIEKRVKALLKVMTLEEKIGQLNQINGGVLTGPQAQNDAGQQGKINDLKAGRIGSFLNVVGAAETKAVQQIAVEQTRLGIPLLFAFDVIHGYKTIFPIPLAESCSWDTTLAKLSAEIAAKEAAASGIHWTFAPMMDISRDPRWGRVMEGAGEDPFLGSAFAAARVRGFQGNLNNNHIMACVKHFAAYGAPEAGREYNTVDMSRYTLWNTYLPPYQAAINAGAATVMNSFNIVDGIPASGNAYLLKKVLKEKWRFNGLIVSDWGSFGEMIAHGYAADGIDAAQKAILAGSQIDMESRVLIDHLAQLVKDKKVPIKVVDEAVSKVLYFKFKLGLFENPYLFNDVQKEKSQILTQKHLEIAQDAARKSMVLLKNDNATLPFSKEVSNVLVVGHLANSQADALDFWSAKGESKDVTTYLEGIKAKLPQKNIAFAEGYTNDGTTNENLLNELTQKAKDAQAIVVVIGITGQLAGEARALTNIEPNEAQLKVIQHLSAMKKPFVVVVHTGRPMVLTKVEALAPAILYSWIGGTKMGDAAADILFGDYNPSARLVMSFPMNGGQIPIYYSQYNTGRPYDGKSENIWSSRYRDAPNTPLYPFGYGLSYSTFEYTNLILDKSKINKTQQITASITVKNTGKTAGEETVQLYLRDEVGSYVRPLKQLKGFQKITLQPNESKVVTFKIDKSMMSYYDENGNEILEPGKFKVFVGANSRDNVEQSFILE